MHFVTEEKELFFLSKLPQFFKRFNKTTKKGKTKNNWAPTHKEVEDSFIFWIPVIIFYIFYGLFSKVLFQVDVAVM